LSVGTASMDNVTDALAALRNALMGLK
jgi:hypothetical protein